MKKSTRHSKITGDFAEALVLYWLSKYGYECARIDHTGIDLIARSPDSAEVMGISVKCRSRYKGTEDESINLPSGSFVKARQACEAFGCVPYYAIVVDGADVIRCFLTSLVHVEELFGSGDRLRYWQMTASWLKRYEDDPQVKSFALHTTTCSWRDSSA